MKILNQLQSIYHKRGLKGSKTLFVMHSVLQATEAGKNMHFPVVIIYLLHEAYLNQILFCILLFGKHISHHTNHKNRLYTSAAIR